MLLFSHQLNDFNANPKVPNVKYKICFYPQQRTNLRYSSPTSKSR